MSAIIVLVSQDSRGRTEVRWYLDLEEWEAGRPIALVSSREHWVDDELANRDVRRTVNRLSENEFEASHSPDLSRLATHRQPIAGDPPEPISRCDGTRTCDEDLHRRECLGLYRTAQEVRLSVVPSASELERRRKDEGALRRLRAVADGWPGGGDVA